MMAPVLSAHDVLDRSGYDLPTDGKRRFEEWHAPRTGIDIHGSLNSLPKSSDPVLGQQFVGVRRMRAAFGFRVVRFGRVLPAPRENDLRWRRMRRQVTR